VQKYREKPFHDQHINSKKFQIRDLVLLYYNKYLQHIGKFQMHWLGLYVIQQIIEIGAMGLGTLDG
jgi:hypothetical protein